VTRPSPQPPAPPRTRSVLSVCLATWDDDPPLGGQGVYARGLRQALVERGVVVQTVAGRGPHAVPYRRLTSRPHVDLTLAINRSPEMLLAGGPDLVHLSAGPGGLHLFRRLPVPVVYTAHHTYGQAHGRLRLRRLYGDLTTRCYRQAAAVAAVSPSTADAVVAAGIDPGKVVVISPGVDADEQVDDAGRVPGRMLFLGRLEPEKGPLEAVAVMQQLARSVPGARGVVVGRGSLARAVADSCRVTGGAVEYRGSLSDAEVAAELRMTQLVLMPSAYEGLGLVALEAMAAGAVVAGFDVEGLHDTIGADGVLVTAGDNRALADACAALLADDAGRRRLAEQALARIRRERSWRRCAEQFEELYRSVLAQA
jgi:glycosyltransferase involved in cell wall biosynthesis